MSGSENTVIGDLLARLEKSRRERAGHRCVVLRAIARLDEIARMLREGDDMTEYAYPKSSDLRSLIEQYLRDRGYHMTSERDDAWGHPDLGEGWTFEQVIQWQIGRELEGRDTPRNLRRELIAELSEQAATYEDERIARLLLRASEEIVLLAGRLTQIAAQKVAAPVGKPSVWDIARELAGRSDPANAPSNTAPGAIEPCPSCGGEMQPDYRLTVGGRTPWVCSACRAVAVDDNEEPHDSEKDVPVRGDTA